MKKNILLRTNLLVCAVILFGFGLIALSTYYANRSAFESDVEQVSVLTSESINHQIDAEFAKPIHISLTMANNSFLKEFLAGEEDHLSDEAYVQRMRNYLGAYREEYQYDSVFLVSTKTNRYYHFNGIDRILAEENEEDVWYYSYLSSGKEYGIQIDNDQAANNEITVFINCRITDETGHVMGVVGVGFRIDSLQQLIREYEKKFQVRAYLIDEAGIIEVSTREIGYYGVNLFDSQHFASLKEDILTKKEGELWYSGQKGKGYLVSQYMPDLQWYLLIDYDVSVLNQMLSKQLFGSAAVVLFVIALVLLTITGIIRKYNARIVELTVAQEKEHKSIFQEAAEQLYENIYEVDITHNRAASEATIAYFESLGAPKNTPFDQALRMIGEKQIKEEYREGYLDTFLPENVLKAHEEGKENLSYDLMITGNNHTYHWIRIRAHIFFWEDDHSVRILVYRQNIDREKQSELNMLEQIQKDSLTGLYNKAATQEQIRKRLEQDRDQKFAFFILDVDNFKSVNDQFGHAAGDQALIRFAEAIQAQFRKEDVVGRIGGDEFVAFMPVEEEGMAEEKAKQLVQALRLEIATEQGACKVTSSIGVALSPKDGTEFERLYRNADAALYATKKRGKNGYTIYK